ncbi:MULTISPECIES: hypothetical protein [unclassified Sedimentibacter]|uniref:hypothetical protein n=1 Tax=unclassified Sedimentibacter TaxID=2649220 RepID=UPI0027E1B919|nr:hypothetical protein [Sedimentibacter sp. MB35-C1]WMJ78468.1 hypothetical protein RBQ61_05980 [Sedimentibacter sp. MB35-C1]
MRLFEIIKNPYTLIFICVIGLLISKFIFKIEYMNCFKIVNNHINVFNNKTGKLLLVPFLTYNILPFLIALGVNRIKVIDSDMVNIITVIISILTSMLFTLLVMLIDMKDKIDLKKFQNANQINIIKRAIKETYHTVMFEILISISVLLLSFVYLFTQKISCIISAIIYYLVFLLVFNLFIVLKRIFNIVDHNFSN